MTESRFHDAMNWSSPPDRHRGWSNRYFIDTEFSDFQQCEMLSLAIVGENGLEFYAERIDYCEVRCSDFVRAMVLPQLGRFEGKAMTLDQICLVLRAWLASIPTASKPTLCFDNAIDLSILRTLLGDQLLDGWMFEDISGRLDPGRRAAYFRRHGGEHHALHDARANAYACSF